jgi:hypothetical protein
MHAGRYQETPASSGYKSQRRNRKKGRKKGDRGKNRRRGSSVGGTALPHCHLRLQLQAAGSSNQGDSLFFKNRGKEKMRGIEPEETVGT